MPSQFPDPTMLEALDAQVGALRRQLDDDNPLSWNGERWTRWRDDALRLMAQIDEVVGGWKPPPPGKFDLVPMVGKHWSMDATFVANFTVEFDKYWRGYVFHVRQEGAVGGRLALLTLRRLMNDVDGALGHLRVNAEAARSRRDHQKWHQQMRARAAASDESRVKRRLFKRRGSRWDVEFDGENGSLDYGRAGIRLIVNLIAHPDSYDGVDLAELDGTRVVVQEKHRPTRKERETAMSAIDDEIEAARQAGGVDALEEIEELERKRRRIANLPLEEHPHKGEKKRVRKLLKETCAYISDTEKLPALATHLSKAILAAKGELRWSYRPAGRAIETRGELDPVGAATPPTRSRG